MDNSGIFTLIESTWIENTSKDGYAVDGYSTTGDFWTKAERMQSWYSICVQPVFTGGTGTFKMQRSVDGETWSDITDVSTSTSGEPIGVVGELAPWVRVYYTHSSGTTVATLSGFKKAIR